VHERLREGGRVQPLERVRRPQFQLRTGVHPTQRNWGHEVKSAWRSLRLGYSNFWLCKLNEFGGNFINAEMVKAFISSIEYGKRFGQ
jgi:hypothetical protein